MPRNPNTPPAPVDSPNPYATPFFPAPPAPPAPAAAAAAAEPRLAARAGGLVDFVLGRAGFIPKPKGDSVMKLEDIVGEARTREIAEAGAIRIHAAGDTGRTKRGEQDKEVAEDMALDYQRDGGGENPALFFHLGDVIYGPDKESAYREEFYKTYKHYPGKIIAIPGNHDGETFRRTDPDPLAAFLANFCADTAVVPPIAGDIGIFRETMTQPGVYWLLDAPFLQIIGLYSSQLENPGTLHGERGDKTQITWLEKTLKDVAKAQKSDTQAGRPRKALVVAVHHPPFSSGGHSGSREMLREMDDCCKAAGVMPDAVLSGHSHNYQRYTRLKGFAGIPMKIPYVVAGCGGHNDQAVGDAFGQTVDGTRFERSRKGFGYLLVTANTRELTIDLWDVPNSGQKPFDTVTVDLQSRQIRQ